MCDITSLPLGMPMCALCSVVFQRRRKRCFPQSVVLLIHVEHARVGKRYDTHRKKGNSPLQFQSVAVQLLDWLVIGCISRFSVCEECSYGETV